MRFEPEHDPDPLRSKFKTIDSLDDLPADRTELMNELKDKISEMLTIHEKNHPEPADRTELMNELKDKISEMLTIHEKNHPEENSLVAYTAFQELQIHSLQHEIKNMYLVLMEMAQALDSLKWVIYQL